PAARSSRRFPAGAWWTPRRVTKAGARSAGGQERLRHPEGARPEWARPAAARRCCRRRSGLPAGAAKTARTANGRRSRSYRRTDLLRCAAAAGGLLRRTLLSYVLRRLGLAPALVVATILHGRYCRRPGRAPRA